MTLWDFVPHDPDAEIDDDELADSLERLHRHLAVWTGELSDYGERIQHTGELLSDDTAMRALPLSVLALLRGHFAEVAPRLLDLAQPTSVLHGGPHFRNVFATPNGYRWIDFETCCRGPIETDLAYLGDASARRADANPALLGLATRMLRISVATTCWHDPDRHPHVREAAEYDLAALAAETDSTAP